MNIHAVLFSHILRVLEYNIYVCLITRIRNRCNNMIIIEYVRGQLNNVTCGVLNAYYY
jgi:hypothetical protein